MSRTRTLYVDQHILERTVASKQSDDSAFDDHEEDTLSFEELEPYLDKIPAREVDLLHMYCCDKKKQKEIATFFSISQGAVSHRITRAMERLGFLRDMPKISDRELRDRLSKAFDEVDTEVVFHMIRTTCQTRTAAIVNGLMGYKDKQQLTQVKVRHKFHKGVELLGSLAEEDVSYRVVSELATYIRKGGLYMLHEVKHSHFERGFDVTLDMGGAL